MKSSPKIFKEVLFEPTTNCNLNCAHCVTRKSGRVLPVRSAIRFLHECKAIGIKRIGFTGGEPFLALDFLYALSKNAVENGMLFNRIMTNGVWFNDRRALDKALAKLFAAGYDGEICVSVDVFHKQDIRKLALFIKRALSIWKRFDIITIASVVGAREDETLDKLKRLAGLLDARLSGFNTARPYIKGKSVFIKILKIELSPIGKGEKLKQPWDGKWFKEDRCKGPGNIFLVEPSGAVKPCCGYATDSGELTIGNINRNSAREIMKIAKSNRFVQTIFNSGLSRIRKRLESEGIKFPGKTTNHCYFCRYILTNMPKGVLSQCLD